MNKPTQTELKIVTIITKFHNQYLTNKKDYKTIDIFKLLHNNRPHGAISGFSQQSDPEIENEWLLDFYWYIPNPPKPVSKADKWNYFDGLDLACEVEWSYPTLTNFHYLLTDLQKLMAIRANTYVFITQLKKEADLDVMVNWLQERLCMNEFRCLFLVLPVYSRPDNELSAFIIENNTFNKI